MARLGDIATTITKGTTPTSIGYDFCEDGINFIKIESISQSGAFLQNKFAHISSECDAKLKRSRLEENDILFSIAGAIGRTAIVDKTILPANTNQALAIIRVPEGTLDYKYLLYALSSPNIIEQFEKQKQGVAQLNISLQSISDFIVPLIEIPIQQQIACILDKVSGLIALRKQQLSKLDELLKSQFIEMFGDLGVNDYAWPLQKLSEACAKPDDIKCGPFGTQLSQSEFVDNGIALWGIPQINSAFTRQPKDFLTTEKAKQLEAYSLIPGDIAMSRKGNVGMCALFPETYSAGIIHSDVLRIRVDSSKFNPVFLMYQLHISPLVETQIGMVSSGAVMAGINVAKLKNILIHVPPIDLQNQFAAFVQQVDKSKYETQKGLDNLETLKKALMQQYFG